MSCADDDLPLLYSYRRCPYAIRARMALLEARRPFRALEVDLRNKPEALLALSEKGTVPVLELPDGRVLDESWDIMAWSFPRGGRGLSNLVATFTIVRERGAAPAQRRLLQATSRSLQIRSPQVE